MNIRTDHQRQSFACTVVRAVAACAVSLLVAGCQHQQWQDTTSDACDGDLYQAGDGGWQNDGGNGGSSGSVGSGGGVGRGSVCDSGECGPLSRLASGESYSRFVDEHFASHEAVRRANRSMRRTYAQAPSFDFQDGYRRAFVEVALGGNGEVPSVPPERYWSTCYRTAAGHQLAQDWFAGYVCGSGRALSLYRYQFNEVATSGLTGLEESTDLDTFRQAPAGLPSRWADEPPPQW